MAERTEVTVDIIIHATEDEKKIYDVLFENFGLEKDDFEVQSLTGHYENPIILLRSRLGKKRADSFIKKLFSSLPPEQIDAIIDTLDERISDSVLHLRIGKQELVMGKISLQENDAVKIKVYTPVYQKKDTIKIYTELVRSSI